MMKGKPANSAALPLNATTIQSIMHQRPQRFTRAAFSHKTHRLIVRDESVMAPVADRITFRQFAQGLDLIDADDFLDALVADQIPVHAIKLPTDGIESRYKVSCYVIT